MTVDCAVVWGTDATGRRIPLVRPGTYTQGKAVYPAGTPIKVLKTAPDGTKRLILIGSTKEQCWVPREALAGGGDIPKDGVAAQTAQAPIEYSRARGDGPAGNFSGVATGEEDIPSGNPEFEARFLELMNAQRRKNGLPALRLDPDLTRAARYQAADMYVQDYLAPDHASHDSIGQGAKLGHIRVESVQERVTRFSPSGKGENAGKIFTLTTPEKAIQGFMDSPGNKENILRPRFRSTGIGYIIGKDGATIVQVFGT